MVNRREKDTASQPQAAVKRRFDGLDLIKGCAMIAMASLHAGLYFDQSLTVRPFAIFDAFIFPLFMFCFGIGYGLSKRPKTFHAALKLALLIAVAGPLALACLGLTHFGSLSPALTSISPKLSLAFTLRSLLPYEDFLLPYVVAASVAVGVQKSLSSFGKTSKWAVAILSLLSLVIGTFLKASPTTIPGLVLLSQGFPSITNLPIFFCGWLAGLFMRDRQLPPIEATWRVLALLTIVVIAWVTHDLYYVGEDVFWWKKSGHLDNLVTSLCFSSLAMISVSGFDAESSPILRWVVQIGKNSMRCLWLQAILLPVLGAMSRLLIPSAADSTAAVAALILIFFLSGAQIGPKKLPVASNSEVESA